MTECAQPGSQLQTWKLTLAYDGTDFQGWQVQPGLPTIQGELQAALGRITGETPLPQGSGRTDAGVHALAQVASFALRAPIPPENLHRALNRTLPPSIRISEARTVRSTFHARHSAIAKTYEYRIFREAICPPFLARYVYACPWALDLDALAGLRPALRRRTRFPELCRERSRSVVARERELFGRHCAEARSSAQAVKPAEADTVTHDLTSSAWEQRQTEAGELLVYRVRGNGFLHHMVRNLVGTMIDVGRGQLALEEIPGILAARSPFRGRPHGAGAGLVSAFGGV